MALGIEAPGILEQLTSETREGIADTLLANSEHLYPVAEEVSRFLQTFSTAPSRLRNRIRAGILRSMEPHRGEWPPDYHLVWMLTVFASSREWGERSELLQIFRTHRSDAVRRFAALALHATGSRPQAVAIKGDWQTASPMTRLAILLASRNLGTDERRHWRTTLGLTGILERLV